MRANDKLNNSEWWDARYRSESTPWDHGTVAPEVIEFARRQPGNNAWAIDIGCGTGTHGRELARNGYRIAAMDLSLVAIQKARAASRDEGLPWVGVQGSVAHLDLFEVELMAALDVGCFHGLGEQDRASYARALNRRLANGGHYLLYAAHPREEGEMTGPPGIAPETTMALFRPYFELIKREPGFHGTRGSDWWLWRKRGEE